MFSGSGRFYPVLSLDADDPTSTLHAFDRLARSGVRLVQWRNKRLAGDSRETLARELAARARDRGVRLIVNDDPRLALRIGAEGVHLGQGDTAASEARKMGLKMVGVSTHSVVEARNAERAGADYIGVGPIFPSPTKPGLEAGGLDLLRTVRRSTRIGISAIGGITPDRALECYRAGADAVSVISALWSKGEIERTVQDFFSVIAAFGDTIKMSRRAY